MIHDLEIRRITEELRTSGNPLWARIRQLLAEKDIVPDKSILAYFAPEEAQYEFGVIVTEGNEVYEFAFDYLQKGVSGGVFAEWDNVTERLERKPYRKEVEMARQLREKEMEGQ
jgi:hypothetical protein